MNRQAKSQRRLQLRQKKLSRAVQLAVLSMSLTPGTVLADVQLDEGGGAAAWDRTLRGVTPIGNDV